MIPRTAGTRAAFRLALCLLFWIASPGLAWASLAGLSGLDVSRLPDLPSKLETAALEQRPECVAFCAPALRLELEASTLAGRVPDSWHPFGPGPRDERQSRAFFATEWGSGIANYANDNPTKFTDPTGHEAGLPAGCYNGGDCLNWNSPPLTAAEEHLIGAVGGTAELVARGAVAQTVATARSWMLGVFDLPNQIQQAKSLFEFASHPWTSTSTYATTVMDEVAKREARGDRIGAARVLQRDLVGPGAITVLGLGEATLALRARLLPGAGAALRAEAGATVAEGPMALDPAPIEVITPPPAPLQAPNRGLGQHGVNLLAPRAGGRAFSPQRPTWQGSEKFFENELAEFGFTGQRSYSGGRTVSRGTAGSVRPDLAGEAQMLSVEVKNYNFGTRTGRYAAQQGILEQLADRAANLPSGMRQGVILDARGQWVSRRAMDALTRRLVVKSNGLLAPEDIHVAR